MSNEPMTHHTFRIAHIFGTCQMLHLCLSFLSAHPPNSSTGYRFTNTFAMRNKCKFIFILNSSDIPHFRVLWGSSCHPNRHHTLAKATVWTGQWSPWTGGLQQAGCFCSSLISHQAWCCHLPWSSVTMAWSREQSERPCEKKAASYSSSDLEGVGGELAFYWESAFFVLTWISW